MDIQKSNKRNWFIRLYQDGDEDQLYEFRRATDADKYNSKESWLKWWHWMYQEFPYEVISFVAEDNGKIIGQLSTQITDIKIGKDIFKTRFSFGYAVHPDYRRQGVALALTAKEVDHFSKNNIHIGYGTPSRSGYQLAMKQGFVNVGCWKRVIKILDWEHFLSKYISNKLLLKPGSFCLRIFASLIFQARKAPDVNGLAIKKVPSFDERINEFLTNISEKFKIIIIKNREYLNWRYATFTQSRFNIYIAEKSGTIRGYMVLSKFENKQTKHALIYEFLAESESIARSLISTVSEHCRRDNIDRISWVGLTDKTHLRAFRKQGFLSYTYRNRYKFVIIYENPNIPQYVTNPQNWLIQLGDLDL